MKRNALWMSVFVVIVIASLCLFTVLSGEQTPSSDTNQISMQLYAADDDTPDVNKAEVNIKAPDRVKIGDLIIIDLSNSLGGGFDYAVEPMPPGLRTFDNGKIIICGTGDKNVVYTFMVSCALGDDSDIAVHKVRVYGAEETGPVPDPGQNLVQKVKDWASAVDSPTKRDDALKLSQSFASIAVIINQDTFDDVGELIRATATSNRDALDANLEHWSPLLDALMKELKAMSSTGQLPDVQSHARIWRDVAQGLREYAETL